MIKKFFVTILIILILLGMLCPLLTHIISGKERAKTTTNINIENTSRNINKDNIINNEISEKLNLLEDKDCKYIVVIIIDKDKKD